MKTLLKKKEEIDPQTLSPEVAQFLRKKKRKKKIIISVSAVCLLVLGIKIFLPKSNIPAVDTYTVAKGNLENKISLSGTVRSENTRKIYNKVNDDVISVNVKLGDKVKKGDVLAVISTVETEREIAKQKIKMNLSSQANALNLYEAEKALQQAQNDISAGTYDQIELMNDSVHSAAAELANARKNYKDNYDSIDADKNEEKVRELERTMILSRRKMEDRSKECEKNGITPAGDSEYIALRQQYEADREKWISSYNLYMEDMTLDGRLVQSALLAYDNILRKQERLSTDIDRNMENLQNNVKKAKLAADESIDAIILKELMENLDDCQVKAPIDGIVSAVYITEGDKAGELLFVIDDDENLIIDGVLRDFDVSKVASDMPVTIKSDSTGDSEINGSVCNVAVAANKDARGNIKEGTAEFPTEIKVKDKNSNLLIGTSVRMKIITAKKENVISVPFDSMFTDTDGKDCVYLAKSENGKYFARKVFVETGMETDFDLEISNNSIQEGDLVITSPESVSEGAEISLVPSDKGVTQ